MNGAEKPALPRVLVVEDEMLVAMLLEDLLAELGYEVVGPAKRLDTAVAMAEAEPLGAAVLDVNLAGQNTYPVADVLRRRGIPFVFATGYGARALADAYRDVPTLQKPFQIQDLERTLKAAIESGGGP